MARNLDFFSTFLEGGRRSSYEPTAASVKRTILEALGQAKRLRYKALWRDVAEYGVTGPRFTDALRELRGSGAIVIDLDAAADRSDPEVVLTPGGEIAADALAGMA